MIDVYPARVTTPTVRWQPARVWISDSRIVVHVQDGPKARLVADLPHDGSAQAGRIHTVTVDGELWTVERRGGCGCGSPLKPLKYETWQAEQPTVVAS